MSEKKKRSVSPSESSDDDNTPLSVEDKRQLIPAFPSEPKPVDKEGHKPLKKFIIENKRPSICSSKRDKEETLTMTADFGHLRSPSNKDFHQQMVIEETYHEDTKISDDEYYDQIGCEVAAGDLLPQYSAR